MVTMVVDSVAHFDAALGTFYTAAAAAISTFVMPIGWVLLAISFLVHSWAIFEGKVSSPVQDWMFKMVAALMILYAMSGGYLNWVGKPLMNLGDQIASVVTGAATGQTVLTSLGNKIIHLTSLIFDAAGVALKELAWQSAVLLVVFGILVTFVSFMLIGLGMFFLIFAKIGLSLVIAVGPFFLMALLTQHTRNYFFSWLNTALYFVFYQVLTIIFIVLFLDIIGSYIDSLMIALGGASFSVGAAILNLLGMGTANLNVVATIIPLLSISIAMFFMLLQIPQIAASITSGSGGSFGNGLYAMSQVLRMGGGGGGGGSGGVNQNRERVQLRPKRN